MYIHYLSIYSIPFYSILLFYSVLIHLIHLIHLIYLIYLIYLSIHPSIYLSYLILSYLIYLYLYIYIYPHVFSVICHSFTIFLVAKWPHGPGRPRLSKATPLATANASKVRPPFKSTCGSQGAGG